MALYINVSQPRQYKATKKKLIKAANKLFVHSWLFNSNYNSALILQLSGLCF